MKTIPDTIPNKVVQMQKASYIPVATFTLPKKCWIMPLHWHWEKIVRKEK